MVTVQEHAAVLAENELLKQQLNQAKELQAAAEARAAEMDAVMNWSDAVRELQDDRPKAKKAKLDRDFVPLEDDDLLDTVLSFVGVDEYLYAGAVSRRWRGRYIRQCHLLAAQKPLSSRPKLRTSYRSAVTTVAKLQLALDSTLSTGQLRVAAETFAKEAVKHSLEPAEVLSLMRAHYCSLSAAAGYAARCNKLRVLQWMHSCGSYTFSKSVLIAAARGGSVPLLQWLCTHTEPWSEKRKNKMLWCAGLKANLPAMQYLREQGAAWPKRFYGTDPCSKAKAKDCWHREAITLVLELGCTWGAWDCAKLNAQAHTGRASSWALFKWAHKHHKDALPWTCSAT
eukprot:6339-Heterococcus_DN1.PRE.2